MSKRPDDLDVLTAVATEVEAAMIVDALKDEGIDASAEGGLTAGLRAEVPGDVRVIVRHEDIDKAQKVLAEYEKGQTDIDWSQVDLDDSQ